MTSLEKRKKPGVNNVKAPKPASNDTGKPVITDDRFKAVHFDPRFASMSKKDRKFKIDARFKPVLSDPRFKMVGEVDKYGRKNQVPKNNKEMEDLYALEDDDQEDLDGIQDEEEVAPTQNKKTKKADQKAAKKNQLNLKAAKTAKADGKKQGKKAIQDRVECFDQDGKFAWNEQSSSESDFDDISIAGEEQEVDDALWESENEDVPEGDATKRLALVNYDWENTKGSDVMLFLSSFLPRGGFIKSVTIYPSEFGLERMKQEDTIGPQGIWSDNKDEDANDKKDLELDANAPWVFKEEQNGDIDLGKLRKYEKDRLKYYYAVIECNSVVTAKHIYDNCDGLEMELTSIRIDLRYIPDDQEFSREPKEVCTEVPATASVNCFLNRAVQHTNVKLTWEEPKLNRFKELEGKFDADDDYDKVDLSRYIADSDSSMDSEDEEEEIAKRRELLLGGGTTDWKDDFDKSKRRKNREEEMIIKFNPGFDALGNKILEKINPEKVKKDKKAKNVKPKEDDEFFLPGEEEVEMTAEEKKKYEAELDLVVNDDKKKNKGEFKFNPEDERFAGLYNNGDKYQIDPTSKFFDPKNSGKSLEVQNKNRRKKVKPN